MSRTTMVLAQARRFSHCWQILERTSAVGCCPPNPHALPTSFLQRIQRRCISLDQLRVPETDVRRFLNHLVDAYNRDIDTEFDMLLQNRLIKKLLNERLETIKNVESLTELESDPEMKELAKDEKYAHESRIKEIDDELIKLIIDNLGSEDFDNIILEITAGVGGQEAMLFVKNILDMYMKHFAYLGYNYDIIQVDNAEQGGVRHASITVSGQSAFKRFRHEAGVHRVQRVPTTEKSGRIHTSVVSVAILPQPSDIQVVIHSKDLRIDTMRASGAGGQHVNTTNSAVRITHAPTGIVVECQTDRSQIRNRELAMGKLRAKIYEVQLSRQLKYANSMRRQQMGMGERNEKIRTYNFNQDRVTDHRISNGTLHNLKGFLDGGEALDGLHEKLHQDLQLKVLAEAVKSVK